MFLRQSTRLKVCGSVLLAFFGVWIGHTVEYVRVWGWDGIRAVLVGSLHAYMLPVLAVLLLLTAVLGARVWRIWNALGRRLDAARAAVAGAWRGRRPEPPPDAARATAASFSGRLVALWLPLSVAQIGLYLVQENLEAVVRGYAAPGLGAVSGIHLPVLLVHALVALLLAALAVGLRRRLHERAEAVVRVENVVRAYLRRVGRTVHGCRPATSWRPAPGDGLGVHLWSRPPPPLLSSPKPG